MEEKLKELLSDEEYVKELVELREPKKISENLSQHGVDLDVQSIEKIIDLVKRKASGELTDADLKQIAGGFDPVSVCVFAITAIGITGGLACIAINAAC